MSMEAAENDRRIGNVVRVGKVASVDPGSAKAVVDFGDLKSPPLPVGQLRAGGLQFWWMPTTGEQVLVACEGGDLAQGVIVCSLYAGNAPSADGAVPQINLAGGKMIVDGDIEVTGDVIASGVSLVNHTHPESIGSNTGKPS
ncbi:phage baseplate assembly protein V [Aliiroseovarius lamellibrachiae]|uniref:phage baseplate assembly protein V n=1 Tax=Aliiroseovarius lamellibrachiae TaxID=1924933 RepID=UPI001BE0E163|nr:phage baseplate assembly protein V [Aliiroseovarius lamellibrachiae]MBT2131224.1 phage baseplate assembly protein V [Aliiroseovarius lamellibrachiae]